MEIKHILIIMFVVFGLFMLANWFNRPKLPRKYTAPCPGVDQQAPPTKKAAFERLFCGRGCLKNPKA